MGSLKGQKVNLLCKLTVTVGCAALLMGNQGCEEQVETRELRRRVSMGKINAPELLLPNGASFDFQYMANAQMYDVLRKSKSFSTSTIDPSKPPSTEGLSDAEADSFNQCVDPDEMNAIRSGFASKTVISERAACLIDLPQGVVNGNVLDFRLKSAGGLSLSRADIPLLSALTFDFKSYEFSMVMNVMDSLIVNHNIAATTKMTYSNEYKVAATMNFSGLELGPSYYYNTPLRQVVEDGMVAALSDLKTQWDTAHPWYSMVVRNCDKSIYINAGDSTDAGLVEGDIVKVHNVKYRWEGEVCSSQLLGSTRNSEVVAYAKITSVGDTMSIAQVIDNDPENYPYSRDQLIKPGARVYMHKMYVAPTKTAKSK